MPLLQIPVQVLREILLQLGNPEVEVRCPGMTFVPEKEDVEIQQTRYVPIYGLWVVPPHAPYQLHYGVSGNVYELRIRVPIHLVELIHQLEQPLPRDRPKK